MTKADQIRRLAAQGHDRAEIARLLGIRYQHVRNVLARSGNTGPDQLRPAQVRSAPAIPEPRPALTVATLPDAGFVTLGEWRLSEAGGLEMTVAAPKAAGVYAFCIDDAACYVGVANMGLAKRLYFYGKPGKTQRTSLRLNDTLRICLSQGQSVRILTCQPPDLIWNGLPVSGVAGLEQGLIQRYALPWNIRHAR